MNGWLLAFFMCTPINETWDPQMDHRNVGEQIFICFKNVNLPLEEYCLPDDEECPCCCGYHGDSTIEQIEQLQTMNEDD